MSDKRVHKNREEWRKIPDFPDYQISSLGRVMRIKETIRKSRWKAGMIKKIQSNGKYQNVCLFKNGKEKMFYIHRLVLSVFVRMPLPSEEGNHIDGNRVNNSLENLEWVSRSENQLHAHRIGLKKGVGCPGRFGILHPLHKLDEGEVFLIKKLIASRKISHTFIAKMFRVSQTEISRIGRGVRWPHIDEVRNSGLVFTDGFCQCGCGNKTSIACINKPEYGWIKGKPMRYLRGHGTRVFKAYSNPRSRFLAEMQEK